MEHHAGTQARCKGTRSKGSMKMTKLEQIYEGKAKKVFRTDDPAYCVVEYKDDATAFNGLKKGTILGKGAVNNRMTNLLMQMLEQQGIPTHFVKELRRPGDRGEKGGDRTPGGHCPQHFRWSLRPELWGGGGDRL